MEHDPQSSRYLCNDGRQTDIGVRFDLVPPRALQKVAEVLHKGALKYGEKNYLKISVVDHINHALNHIYGALYALRKTEDDVASEELSHAICRLLFSLDIVDTTDYDYR